MELKDRIEQLKKEQDAVIWHTIMSAMKFRPLLIISATLFI